MIPFRSLSVGNFYSGLCSSGLECNATEIQHHKGNGTAFPTQLMMLFQYLLSYMTEDIRPQPDKITSAYFVYFDKIVAI